MVKKPKKTTYRLKEKCPICKDGLYTYWDTCAGDMPELGRWYIECNNWDCNYEMDRSFSDLDIVKKSFNLLDKQKYIW